MLRADIAAGTELGKKAQTFMNRGDLVPDAVVIGMISARIEQPDCAQGVIFDGFPRTVPQAQALDKMLDEKGRPLQAVIELAVDEEELVNRLHTRIEQTKAAGKPLRADDNEQTLRHRLKVYREQTSLIIPYYRERGLLQAIDGMKEIKDVEEAIKAALGIGNSKNKSKK